ncbi:TetR-like C-terminal domain-containing protein [Bosea sp. RCC_152_1]|uniref:TetR-like C-terminal domain-containing protein n=1 Tax=Bosea sp. RCC_152_1 TaxID=3239228 RepID=UPI00352421EE
MKRSRRSAARTWWDGFVAPRRASTARSLTRAKARGEINGEVDAEWICDLLTGPLICRAFLGGYRGLPDELAEETTRFVMSSLATADSNSLAEPLRPGTQN